MSKPHKITPHYDVVDDRIRTLPISVRSMDATGSIMTEERLSEIKSAFEYFDYNHDGYINRYELRKLLMTFGINPEDNSTRNLVNEIAREDNFQFSLEHIIIFIGHLAPRQEVYQQIRSAFSFLDSRSQGTVSLEEGLRVLRGCARGVDFPLSMASLQDILGHYTEDGRLHYQKLIDDLVP